MADNSKRKTFRALVVENDDEIEVVPILVETKLTVSQNRKKYPS
jgi:hypothetical protein